jgi:hypothetical protein
MKYRIIVAITACVALSTTAALFAPAAYGAYQTYSSFKSNKHGQMKAESKTTKVKPKNALVVKSSRSDALSNKATKSTPKVPVLNPHLDQPKHTP